MTIQCRKWIFTLNNFTSQEETLITNSCGTDSIITYLIFSKEIAPTTGTPHLQGYLELSKKKTLAGVKKLPGFRRASFRMARGTAKDQMTYIRKLKTDTPQELAFEYGTIMKQGKRSDLEQVKQDIDDGMSLDHLWENHFTNMVRYRNGMQQYFNRVRSKSRPVPLVYVFHGPTGTGKTRAAYELDPDSFWVYPGKGWFDGYEGQSVAIFDEFDGTDIAFSLWKRLCDRYPMLVPVKGGFVPWIPEKIVFTSNFRPQNWWKDDDKPLGWYDQFTRRITEERLMNQINES